MIFGEHDNIIRLAVFASILIILMAAEFFAPRKRRVMARSGRWITNFGLTAVSTVALRFLMPLLALAAAQWAEQRGWGLLNIISLPAWLRFLVAFVALDMLIYAQHIAFHRIPLFWRFHKVHHADRDLDVTSGARFHPGEALISMIFKIACVIALGAPVAAVFVFEAVLNAASLFSHSNIAIPQRADIALRRIIVTPDMHRVHHSVVRKETDSNFGFFLSVWDRLFRTYIAQPASGHDGMTIGLSEYQSDAPNGLWWSLKAPFMAAQKSEKRKRAGNSLRTPPKSKS